MKNIWKKHLLVISAVCSIAHAEQTCNDYLDSTSTTKTFIFAKDGKHVTDKRTGLVWQRCLVGQSLNTNNTPDNYQDDTCSNLPTPYSRQDALQYISKQTGYRLPNVKELASISELKCANPAINLVVFPDQPNSWVWSATPVSTGTAYSVSFETGTIGINGAGNSLLRLIQD